MCGDAEAITHTLSRCVWESSVPLLLRTSSFCIKRDGAPPHVCELGLHVPDVGARAQPPPLARRTARATADHVSGSRARRQDGEHGSPCAGGRQHEGGGWSGRPQGCNRSSKGRARRGATGGASTVGAAQHKRTAAERSCRLRRCNAAADFAPRGPRQQNRWAGNGEGCRLTRAASALDEARRWRAAASPPIRRPFGRRQDGDGDRRVRGPPRLLRARPKLQALREWTNRTTRPSQRGTCALPRAARARLAPTTSLFV